MQDGSTSMTVVHEDGGNTQATQEMAQNSSYENPYLTLATRHQQYAAYVLSSHRFNSSEAVIYTGINNKAYSNIYYPEGSMCL